MIDIKSIWAKHTVGNENIIKTKIDEIEIFDCFAATNCVTGQHFYVMQISNASPLPDFRMSKFRGVVIEILIFEKHKELTIVLLDIDLKDIFSMFIDDILNGIKSCLTEYDALTSTSNVIFKWKKLFDKVAPKGLTLESQKGLIGELLFLKELIDDEYPIDNLFQCWVGPDKNDKDFIFGSTGFEVKLTSSKYPVLKITNERQLDEENLTRLFIVLYILEEVHENGFSLTSLITEIQEKVKANYQVLNLFNQRLFLAGYQEEDSEIYNIQFALKNSSKYLLSEGFPRIQSSNLPKGIYNTSYSIGLSACEPFLVKQGSLKQLIK